MKKDMLDSLIEYFENTPKEKIKSDWVKSEKYDKVKSPTIKEFLKNNKNG